MESLHTNGVSKFQPGTLWLLMGQLSKTQPCLPVLKHSVHLEDVGRLSAMADVKGWLGEVS